MSGPGRRVFRDPADEDRLDEDWRPGVLVGGMASATDDVELARAYAEAAARLIDPALESGEAWRLCYPILYLYRHALELYLKAAVRPAKPRHELRPLIDELEQLLRERPHIAAIPDELRADLLTLATVDPDAQGFRYSHRRDGTPQLLPGEHWVPLADLQRFAEQVFTFLEGVLRRL